MKKIFFLAFILFSTLQVDAQDLKSILSGVVNAVVGDKATTAQSIIGTWNYVGPDCQLKGDDLLKQVGGAAAGTEIEKNIESVYKKTGLNTISYTFNEDMTCSYTIKGKTYSGTYEFNPEGKTIVIKTGKLGLKITASVVTVGSNMSFMFDADKILSVVKTITGVASKFNSTASALNKLAAQFDGMLIGFELKRQ